MSIERPLSNGTILNTEYGKRNAECSRTRVCTPIRQFSIQRSSPAIQYSPSRCSAFTLIELLVVMSIISILMSMMLPALGKARKQAHLIDCTNSLRQIGMIIQLYANDNDDRMPAGYQPDLGTASLFVKNANWNGPTGLGILFPWVGDPRLYYKGESNRYDIREFDRFTMGPSSLPGDFTVESHYFYTQWGHGSDPKLCKIKAEQVIVMDYQAALLSDGNIVDLIFNHDGMGTHILRSDGSVDFIMFGGAGGILYYNCLDPDNAFERASQRQ